MNDPHFVRYQRFFNEPHKYKPIKGAQSYESVMDRAEKFFNEHVIPLEGKYENVLVVGHTTWMHAYIIRFTGRPMSELWKSSFGKNCEAIIFEVKDGKMEMVCENKMFYDEADLTQ